MVAWLAGAAIPFDDAELHGALRRSLLLLAAGGDPHRALDLDDRAVTSLADELDRPERREALARGLAELPGDAEGLPISSAAIGELLGDADLAWRAFAAGLLGEELADA